jgi:serine/threonine protein kinase
MCTRCAVHLCTPMGASDGALVGQERPVPMETWLLLEYCDRSHLGAAIAKGKFRRRADGAPDMVAILRSLLEIASGMAYLHSLGVLHGDLKPENVLLTSKSQGGDARLFTCKLGDFGMSRLLESGTTHMSTQTYGPRPPPPLRDACAPPRRPPAAAPALHGTACVGQAACLLQPGRSALPGAPGARRARPPGGAAGTVAYQPAELLRDGRLSPAADVYSFAILMYELFAGGPAWEGYISSQVPAAPCCAGFANTLRVWQPRLGGLALLAGAAAPRCPGPHTACGFGGPPGRAASSRGRCRAPCPAAQCRPGLRTASALGGRRFARPQPRQCHARTMGATLHAMRQLSGLARRAPGNGAARAGNRQQQSTGALERG